MRSDAPATAPTPACPALTDLHIRLVAKCNLNCAHCYASDWFVRSDVLDAGLVCDAIDQAIPLGLQKVTFTGGEPTLHRGLPAMLLHCVQREVKAKLETNGILLRRHDDEIVRLIIDHRDLIYLYVSYDLALQRGISDEEHQAIRDLVIHLHRNGVDVRVQSSLTGINIDHLDDLLELARNYGIPQRIFFDHSVLGNGVSLENFDLDTVLRVHQYLNSLGLNLEFELPPLITGQISETCGWGIRRCEIMPNGDVTTCAPITFTHTRFTAGNLHQQPLSAIWRNSDYFLGMREVTQRDFQGVCGKCDYWENCRGSCRAYAWSHAENWFSPYPLCQAYATKYPERVHGRLHDADVCAVACEDKIERLPRVKTLATTGS
jgi:radical SAM protein with 4Fe4S-binding SPASM domain